MRGVEEEAGVGGGGGELGGLGGVGGGGGGMVKMGINKKKASTLQKTYWTNYSCLLNPLNIKPGTFWTLPGGGAGLPQSFFLFSGTPGESDLLRDSH